MGQAGSAGQAEYYLRQYWIEWLLCAAASVPLVPWLKERFYERTWAYTAGKACTWLIFLYYYIKLVTGSFNPFIYFHF